jgi:hypothetical protein
MAIGRLLVLIGPLKPTARRGRKAKLSRARSEKVGTAFRSERAQPLEWRARFSDQAIPPDLIVL